jgi:hypothetical protein
MTAHCESPDPIAACLSDHLIGPLFNLPSKPFALQNTRIERKMVTSDNPLIYACQKCFAKTPKVWWLVYLYLYLCLFPDILTQ